MKLEDLARVYVSSVELEDRIQAEAPTLADEIGTLRADLHALWMEALRDQGIPFADRADAARLAFDIARNTALPLKP